MTWTDAGTPIRHLEYFQNRYAYEATDTNEEET